MSTYDTKYTTENLTTSVAKYLADSFKAAGWAVYWQATGVLDSGTVVQGEVTIVPEFPNDPNLLVLSADTRTADKVILPAFTISVIDPQEELRAGLGEDLFESRSLITIEGYVVDEAQHLAFATMLRNWFREDYALSIYDYTANPTSPELVADDVQFENRIIDRVKFVDLPRPVRYYINLEVDIVYFD